MSPVSGLVFFTTHPRKAQTNPLAIHPRSLAKPIAFQY
jgi:hypothetical protein